MMALMRFPRMARIRRLQLYMHPTEAAHWLLATHAAGREVRERLADVNHVEIWLYPWEDGEPSLLGNLPVSAEVTLALGAALGLSLPNLCGLSARIPRHEGNSMLEVIVAFFQSLGSSLSHLKDLEVGSSVDTLTCTHIFHHIVL